METKNYVGQPESGQWDQIGTVVVMAGATPDAEQYELDPRYDLVNHSPSGFGWGYYGSGAAQLAFAILADASGNPVVALKHYQAFKSERIAALPRGPWKITVTDVRLWLAAQVTHNGRET